MAGIGTVYCFGKFELRDRSKTVQGGLLTFQDYCQPEMEVQFFSGEDFTPV